MLLNINIPCADWARGTPHATSSTPEVMVTIPDIEYQTASGRGSQHIGRARTAEEMVGDSVADWELINAAYC